MQYFKREGDPLNRNVAKGETVYFKDKADRYKACAAAFAWQPETLTDHTPGDPPPTFRLKGTVINSDGVTMQPTVTARGEDAPEETLLTGLVTPATDIYPASYEDL